MYKKQTQKIIHLLKIIHMGFLSNTSLGRLLASIGGSNDRFVRPPFLNANHVYHPGSPTWDQIQGKEFDIYETTGILQVVLNRKAQMKSSGKWKHFRITNNGPVELENTPILQLLDNPNPLQSKDEYLKQLSIHRDIHGAAYIYALQGSALADAPSALWNLLPRLMTIQTTGKLYQQTEMSGIIKNFIFDSGGGAEMKFDADEILFRRLENPSNPILPLSPFVALSMEISNIRAAMGFRNVVLRKKGAIGILSNQSKDADGAMPLSPEERERIEKQYQKDYGISDKQSQVIITNASMSWEPMIFETDKMKVFEEVDANMRKIIDAYGLNDNIFSRDKASTFTNVLEGERLAYQDTIIPESADDAKALSEYLGLTARGEFLELDYSHLPAMKDDEVKKSQILERKARALAILMDNNISEEESRMLVGLENQPD